jgi:hypothetical protein
VAAAFGLVTEADDAAQGFVGPILYELHRYLEDDEGEPPPPDPATLPPDEVRNRPLMTLTLRSGMEYDVL